MGSPIQDPEGSPQPAIGAAAPVDLDLAFSAAEGVAAELLQACGVWCDPLQAEDAWQALLAHWLAQLGAELPPELRSEAYSLGLSLVDDGEIAALNADWRGKAGPTDVLAFAAQDDGLDGAPSMPLPGWAIEDHNNGNDQDQWDEDEWDVDDEVEDDEQANEAEVNEAEVNEALDGAAEPLELGDIVISLETAARQAPEHGHSLNRELLFLASHGLLHLLGWDHPDAPSLQAMLDRQELLMAATLAETEERS